MRVASHSYFCPLCRRKFETEGICAECQTYLSEDAQKTTKTVSIFPNKIGYVLLRQLKKERVIDRIDITRTTIRLETSDEITRIKGFFNTNYSDLLRTFLTDLRIENRLSQDQYFEALNELSNLPKAAFIHPIGEYYYENNKL